MANGFDADKAVGFCATCPGGVPQVCSGMQRDVRKKCKVDDNRDFRRGRERLNDRLKKSKKGRKTGIQVRNKTWKDDHCGALLFNPAAGPDELRKKMEDLVNGTQELKDDLVSMLEDLGIDVAKEALVSYGEKAAARQVAGLAAGPIGTGVMFIANVASSLWSMWSAWDEISTIKDVVKSQLEVLQDIQQRAADILGAVDDPERLKELKEKMVNEMKEAVNQDACLTARRCFLVPYKNKGEQFKEYDKGISKDSGGPGLFDRAPFDLSDSRGCCPGQTGHHLIPEAWLKDEDKKLRCKKYNHNAAPTVCAEGYDGRYGTHGEAHGWLNETLNERGKTSQTVTMNEAIDLAVEGFTRPGSLGAHCNKKCIKEQLDSYYKNADCSGIVPKLQPGVPSPGGPVPVNDPMTGA